ncbi:MAG: TonB-dependent receptor, partial [Deltaproteobacteria bacterium]|nr:TonB-dependent receptor [Deltaproteobacteria bacterium]
IDGVDGIDVVQSPAYYDYQFMIENKPDPDSRFRVSFYGSDDGFEIVGEDLESETTGGFDLHMAFMRGQASYQSKLTGGHQVDAMFSLNRDIIDFSIYDSNIGRFFVDVEVRSMSNRLGYSHRITDWLALNSGLDIVGGEATVTTRLPTKLDEEEDDDGAPSDGAWVPPEVEEQAYHRTFFRPAGFIEGVFTPARHLRIVPGVRLDYSLRTDSVDVSPRLNASYGLFAGFPQTTLKAAVGLYPQPPDFLKIIGAGEIDHLESNRAVHYGLGLEQDITRQLEVSFEGFVKQLSNLVVTIDGEGDADPRDENDGKGYAVGGELMVKYKPDAHFFGWLAYTLSRSARRDQPNEDEVLVTYDQTHILTVLGSYRLGAGWEVGARFRLVSGNLITPLICNPEDEGCEPTIGSIYHAPSGSYIKLPGAAQNSERLPLFHQLDLRVDKTWTFDSWKFGMYLDVMNVYNHMADEGVRYSYDFANREYVGGLPIIPSLGMRGQF